MSSFDERKQQRMKKYGATIERNGEKEIIKKFQHSYEGLESLEKIRAVFYPELKKGLKMDKTVAKIIRTPAR